MKLIAFVGYPLSGKSTATSIARELGIPVVVMGDVVRKEVERRGLDLSDENTGRIASELREKEGMDAIAKRCIPEIIKLRSNLVVIDGIRGIDEVLRFKKEFGEDFILIAIDSAFDNRFRRALKRRRGDDIRTEEELRRRDEREESWGLREAFDRANLIVENNSDINSFKDKIREIFGRFTKRVEVEIEAKVHPTEDEEKVKSAIKNLFPDAELTVVDKNGYGIIKGKSEKIDTFRELLRRQRILDTARFELINGVSGNKITLLLNKQTATVSRINFVEEDTILSPLVIKFKIYGIDLEKFIDFLAPETKNGKPVKELKWEDL
jgi:predicted RNA binding protein with dsRBD fold (UPF0201 family)/cytidylate kinase